MNRRGRVDNVFNIDLLESNNSDQYNDFRTTENDHPYYNNSSSHPISQSLNRMDNIENYNNTDIYDENSRSFIELSHRYNKGNQTVRDKAISEMPSRLQKAFSYDGGYNTPSCDDDEIRDLAEQIEHQEHLMDNTPSAAQHRMDTIKAMPRSLTIKRKLKKTLEGNLTEKSNEKIGALKEFKYRIEIRFKRIRVSINNTITNIELWYGSLKTIEGHFGSSVAAYFKFLRWLFVLNLLLFFMTIGFIVIPQMLFNNTDDHPSKRISEKNLHANETNYVLENDGEVADFHILDILTGEGYLTSSILFYGSYTNMTFSLSSPQAYSIPYAYFMTMICLYIATFIIVSISMARSYRKSFIESYGGVQNFYSHKVFCSWDFGISIEKAAELKKISIYNELREMLYDSNRPQIEKTRLRFFYEKSIQITAHILVFAMLAGLALGMWALLKDFGETDVSKPWTALYLSLTVNGTMLVLQMIFSWISYMEQYKSRRTTVHINLFRNFLLEMVIIGVLFVFWLTRKETKEKTGYTIKGCWETSIGQEIYRLVVVDLLITVTWITVFQGIRVLFYKKWPAIGQPEFNISTGTVTLVFNQILLWVGLLFSPLLATIIIIKFVIIFYIKKLSLMYLCKPPTHLWRSAQTQTLYLVLIFLALLGVVVLHGYIITQVKVSRTCGPFRNYDYMFKIFLNGILELKEENLFWRIVMSITKPAVVGGFLLALCVIVYYVRAKSKARIAMVELLKEMLFMEGLDKEYLLSNISKVTQGKEWMFDHDIQNGRDRVIKNSEPSSTWQFNRKQNNSEIRSRPVSINYNNNAQPSTSRHQRLSKEYSTKNRPY